VSCPVMRAVLSLPLLVVASSLLVACGRSTDTAKPSAGSAPVAKAAVEAPPLPKPPTAKYQRDFYGKLDDCAFDWGFAGKCAPVAGDAPERAQGAIFAGPIYSNALRFEAQIASRREAVDQGYARQLDETPSNRAIASSDVKS